LENLLSGSFVGLKKIAGLLGIEFFS